MGLGAGRWRDREACLLQGGAPFTLTRLSSAPAAPRLWKVSNCSCHTSPAPRVLESVSAVLVAGRVEAACVTQGLPQSPQLFVQSRALQRAREKAPGILEEHGWRLQRALSGHPARHHPSLSCGGGTPAAKRDGNEFASLMPRLGRAKPHDPGPASRKLPIS